MTLIDSILRAGEPANESAGKRPPRGPPRTLTRLIVYRSGPIVSQASLGKARVFCNSPGSRSEKGCRKYIRRLGAGSRTSELTERA